MKITNKVKKIMEANMEVFDDKFIWHGGFKDEKPAITIDGVVYDARDVAWAMGINNEDIRRHHAGMEQIDRSGSVEDTGDGDSESES